MSETQVSPTILSSLKKRADFLHVQKQGGNESKWVSKSFIIQICPNENKGQRFGLVVTKKLYKLAVDRNRVKRRLREAIKETLPTLALDNTDYVFIARSDTRTMAFETLKKDMKWCLKRLNALREQ